MTLNLIPDISNASSWLLNQTLQAVASKDSLGKNIPIELRSTPIDKSVVIVRATSTSELIAESWKFAGQVFCEFNVSVPEENIGYAVAISQLWVSLEKGLNLVIFPKIAPSIILHFYAPKWFDQIQYQIFKYVGDGYLTLEEKLQAIYNGTNQLGYSMQNINLASQSQSQPEQGISLPYSPTLQQSNLIL